MDLHHDVPLRVLFFVGAKIMYVGISNAYLSSTNLVRRVALSSFWLSLSVVVQKNSNGGAAVARWT